VGARGGSRKLLVVSEARAAVLVDRILERRRRADDPLLSRASDDIPSLVRYVAQTTSRQVEAHVLREDVLDALELLEYARQRLPAVPGVWDQLEYQLLSIRRRCGLSLQDIADRLQVSRYAVDKRAKRGAAADKGLLRSEVADRVERRAAGAIARWHETKALSVRTVMRVLEERIGELGDDQDLVDMVEILTAPDDDRRPPAVTDPVSAADMRLLDRVVRMVRSRPVFEALSAGSRVRAAVEQGEALVAQYRELTAEVERWRKDLG
jgi:transcriptional regulator with XRE-family HTH domain